MLTETSSLLTLVAALAPSADQVQLYSVRADNLLGARGHFMVRAGQEDHAKAAVAAARAEIGRLDGVFNSRKASSELFQLNRAGSGRVSPELFEVIAQAEDLRLMTNGAFNPALGVVHALWRADSGSLPAADALKAAAGQAQPELALQTGSRTVTLPAGAQLDLDGLAKGYIVDKALEAGLAAAPSAHGMLVDIGGEMRCAGLGPDNDAWRIGVPDGSLPFANASLVAEVNLRDAAIATSGVGPRDRRIAGMIHSATFDPGTGQAAARNLSASVVARTAAQADGLATALLVMPAHTGQALADSLPGVEARITDRDGRIHLTRGWTRLANELPPPLVRVANTGPADPNKWQADWAVQLNYQAPAKQQNHDPEFRSPYMALWITDKAGKPVRTIMLVGGDPKYQKENFIWWGLYKDQAPKLVELRSGATSLSGQYALYWPGYDDAWKMMPLGDYVLHVETSQEHGEHTYRTLPLTLSKQGFKAAMPATKEGGGLEIVYGHRD